MTRTLLWLLLLPTAGCGVILGHAGGQELRVTTSPAGAAVIVNEVPNPEVSPCLLTLSPTQTYAVRVVLGDRKASRMVRKSLRFGVAVCDAIFTAGLGLLVDYFTGALYWFQPEMNFDLTPRPPTTPGGPTLAACPVCGEARGEASPCPHCGVR